MSSELARIGGPLGAFGLAVLLTAPRREVRMAGLAAWALGGLALVPYLLPEGQKAMLAAAAALGLGLAAAGAFVLRRWPWALALGALACAPARIPVDVGDAEANLLVPLYGIVAAAALVLGYDLLRGDGRARELGSLAWPLAALVAWSGLSLLWTDDLREGAIDLLFFFLPFGLLAVCLARLPWSRSALQLLYAMLAAMALLFAAIGIYQWATRDIFWNPKVDVGNAFAPFFRVNSVFWDPSIYGRFLVIAILATLVIALSSMRRELVAAAALLIAVLWTGLLFSFSQSSFAALIAGVLLAAAYVWRWRSAAAVGLAVVVMLTVGFSAPQLRDNLLEESRRGLDRATSGRYRLMEEGARIALDNPLGVGQGGFKRAYAERTGLRGEEPARAASHNTPITVAAETGLLGLALLVWLVAAAIVTALRLAGKRRLTGRVALFIALGTTAIAVHSLFYDAFFEDPMTWGLLALAAVTATAVASATATPEDEGLRERLSSLRSRQRVEVGT